MIPAHIIAKKRDGLRLSQAEICQLIEGFMAEWVTDYQMSAFAMAVCIRGMDAEETQWLTEAMLDSGSRLCRGDSERPRVDKHSTGGQGDKVSLLLAPLLACCGVEVPMISGRALGITGGTLDKLESIPGFRSRLVQKEIDAALAEVGCCIIGADESIAPADRRLYALRDTSGTVESIALITASILSKKLAASLDALVMDVKVGGGGFMPEQSQAEELAETLRSTARGLGLAVDALLTDMEQPLGKAVGNAVEVNEAMRLLRGEEHNEVVTLTIELASRPLLRVGAVDDLSTAKRELEAALSSGQAYERFRQMVEKQGGRLPEDALDVYPAETIEATDEGIVESVDAALIGRTIVEMGGGRKCSSDRVDHKVGIEVLVRVGDAVEKGQPLLRFHSRSGEEDRWRKVLGDVARISGETTPRRPLLLEVFDE